MRSRRWLVEEVVEPAPGQSLLVRLACAEDDAQGETLTAEELEAEEAAKVVAVTVAESAAPGRARPSWTPSPASSMI